MKRQISPGHKKNSPRAPLQTHINAFSIATRISVQSCSCFISDLVLSARCVLSNKWKCLIIDVYSSAKKSTLERGNPLAFIYTWMLAKEIYSKTAWRGSICAKTTHVSKAPFQFFLLSPTTEPSRFLSGLNQTGPAKLWTFHFKLWYASWFEHFLKKTFHVCYDATSVLFGSVYCLHCPSQGQSSVSQCI